MTASEITIGRGAGPLAQRRCGLFGVNVLTPPDGMLVVLELIGELDIESIALFKEALVERPAGTALVLDLRRLAFIASTGLRAILETLAAAREGDWRLGLLEGPPALRRVFEISGLAPMLPFVAEPEDVL